MPEPQRVDGGSTQVEDSVSSFILESMNRDHGSRKIKAIRLCTSSLNKSSRVWGHNSFYGLLKVLDVGLKGPLGPKSTIQDLPLSSGEVNCLYGPGPTSMLPGHIGKYWELALFFGPLDPLKP
ncbi:hypothetical protein O181_070184 [Austropuccinia psidii MF-1]|uniref:Uncharacterized protein n=1 Tax=Austropuccinia psidii MF-1 TaxID=1389203 RepID=A0A9Q3I986_9BASI|nr:hypothetical protein [Austropuccinia psidii MF-1]